METRHVTHKTPRPPWSCQLYRPLSRSTISELQRDQLDSSSLSPEMVRYVSSKPFEDVKNLIPHLAQSGWLLPATAPINGTARAESIRVSRSLMNKLEWSPHLVRSRAAPVVFTTWSSPVLTTRPDTPCGHRYCVESQLLFFFDISLRHKGITFISLLWEGGEWCHADNGFLFMRPASTSDSSSTPYNMCWFVFSIFAHTSISVSRSCFGVDHVDRAALEVTRLLFTHMHNTCTPDSRPSCVVLPVDRFLIVPPRQVNVAMFPASHTFLNTRVQRLGDLSHLVSFPREFLLRPRLFCTPAQDSIRGKCELVEGGATLSAAPESTILENRNPPLSKPFTISSLGPVSRTEPGHSVRTECLWTAGIASLSLMSTCQRCLHL